jgi:hypothetical protein
LAPLPKAAALGFPCSAAAALGFTYAAAAGKLKPKALWVWLFPFGLWFSCCCSSSRKTEYKGSALLLLQRVDSAMEGDRKGVGYKFLHICCGQRVEEKSKSLKTAK